MSYLLKGESLEKTKVAAFRICQEFLGGPWNEITIEEFVFSEVNGGLSNMLYHCARPLREKDEDESRSSPREVLYRLYGPLQDEAGAIVAEVSTFMLLSERGLGPRLYGVFQNGRLEEFIPSRSLKTQDYRRLAAEIGKQMGKIHALEVPIKKTYDFWENYMIKWMKEVKSNHFKKHNTEFPLLNVYEDEMAWLLKEIKKTNSPLVFCHNDLQGGNILLHGGTLDDSQPKLTLIDFEFGAYNYRGFDIANQFCEWCFDYALEEFPHFTVDFNKFPTEEEQLIYIGPYLGEMVKAGMLHPDSIESEARHILQEVKVFVMCAHLLWSLWSEKMVYFTSMDFAHKEHGKTRWKAYYMFKELYLKNCCNGSSDQNSH